MKNIEKFVELSTAECEDLNGGGLLGALKLLAKVISGVVGGYSVGFGWGSYDCDCIENDGSRFDEIGPSHYRA
jgi:hypothetical protein